MAMCVATDPLVPFVVRTYEQYGPLFRTQNPFGPGEVLYMVGPEANRFILTTDRLKFSHYQCWGIDGRVEVKFGHGLQSMDGEEYVIHRHMLNPSFTSSAPSKRYFKTMSQIIESSVASWQKQENVDVYEEARRITFAVIARGVFPTQSDSPSLSKLSNPTVLDSEAHLVNR
jgi:cytochrome P450